ncbi:MAG: cobalamin-dependent protein, partial [Nitrospiraceae bacterium]|nr:cobalamin-dependent protein [Nitrospiraceae bacterium]
MKVLFYNPPFLPKFSRFSRSPAVTKSGTIYYPNWHAYAAGWLEKKGHEVMLLDAPARGLSRADSSPLIADFKPDIAVVYTSTPSIYNDVEVAGGLKEALPGCFVVLTGPHVSALPEETLALDPRIDAVARGEYDATIAELAEVLPDTARLGSVKGISYRNGTAVVSNPDREFIEDLDAFPFVSEVYRKHLKVEDYFYAHCRFPVVSIFTSRGCYAKCNYCVYPKKMFGRRQRQRSPDNIVGEWECI